VTEAGLNQELSEGFLLYFTEWGVGMSCHVTVTRLENTLTGN
jgi:hypothetical protein